MTEPTNSRKDAEAASKLTFEAAWAEMEKRGYRYGRDALAGVKFGWKLHEEWNTAHSRKDAEPVDIRAAMKRAFNLGQTYWQQADSEYVSQQNKSDATRAKFNELLESTMDHVSNPPEADKLLQQALEALDNSVDVVREEYTEAVRRYSGLPSHKARLDSLNALLTKHESSITDIRTYLEGKK